MLLETFVVFGDSDLKAHITLQSLCSTSSGCCRDPHSQAVRLSVASCRSPSLQSEQRGVTHHSQAANESRMRTAAAIPALAYRAGCGILPHNSLVSINRRVPFKRQVQVYTLISNHRTSAESNLFFLIKEGDVATDTTRFPLPFSHIVLAFCQSVPH